MSPKGTYGNQVSLSVYVRCGCDGLFTMVGMLKCKCGGVGWGCMGPVSGQAETHAAGVKDMGKVIGALKAKFAGQMDFGKASGLVKAALTG